MQSLDHEAFVYLTRDETVGHRIRVCTLMEHSSSQAASPLISKAANPHYFEMDGLKLSL